MTSEIRAFAGALRQMADNADTLAERHDLRHVALLHQMIDEQAATARRNQDLVDELRRQVQAMGHTLETIGRASRKARLGDSVETVKVLTEALVLLAGQRCSSFTSGDCARAGRTRGAKYMADAWCSECIARDALERAGALPPAVD